jgi:endonuclease-3
MSNNDTIIRILGEHYAHTTCGLTFDNPFELLISTILSAQCTDKQVNKITPALFKRFPDAFAMALADEEELRGYIKSCGFYRTKGHNIIEACKTLCEQYGGEVPADIEKLRGLRGVGRKTANVVASFAFGIPAIAVDTHVFRVANRLGLADAKNELNTEKQLMEAAPREIWSDLHHWIIWHGREICKAQRPLCDICMVKEYCKMYNAE